MHTCSFECAILQDMFDWDDLRIFLEAARTGSLTGASQRLSVDAATVGRRIRRLETAVKSTLLSRSPTGLRLTATGAQLLEVGLNVESAMESATRAIQPDAVSGTVRISTAEGFGSVILAPALPSLLAQRPGLVIELAAQGGLLSPTRREVDMAVTLSPPAGARLVVEPLTTYQLALFAAPAYLTRAQPPLTREDLRSHQVVGYVDDLIFAPELRYLDELLPGLAPRVSSSSIQAQRAIIAAGGGVGVLPFFLAKDLVRILPEEQPLHRRFWLSTHQDVHDTARMRAVRTWLKALVAEQAGLLSPL